MIAIRVNFAFFITPSLFETGRFALRRKTTARFFAYYIYLILIYTKESVNIQTIVKKMT